MRIANNKLQWRLWNQNQLFKDDSVRVFANYRPNEYTKFWIKKQVEHFLERWRTSSYGLLRWVYRKQPGKVLYTGNHEALITSFQCQEKVCTNETMRMKD